jgi:hypothetical protein
MKTSDLVVHLHRALAAGEREKLERALSGAPGISAVRGSPGARQLIVVDFDPAAITPLGVLQCVRAFGVEARLVGM